MINPLTSSRFKNMISDYLIPMDKPFDTFGDPPFSLEQGVEQTAEWLEMDAGSRKQGV